MAPRSNSDSANGVAEELKETKIKNEDSEEELGTITLEHTPRKERQGKDSTATKETMEAKKGDPDRLSTPKDEAGEQSPLEAKAEGVEIVEGEISLKMEPGEPPKLARSSSHKIPTRTPPLFDHLPDKTHEATQTFQLLTDCSYRPKGLGNTEHSMECDCGEEWDRQTKTNVACGEDSDCINRATKMECVGDCGCGADCENKRFQNKEFARVDVFQTEKKGYGLRCAETLRPNQFIFEYIGEVINEDEFEKRRVKYDEEGIKHFYFMSLRREEFIDATKKGNLGRFCNHSCNPNCYVDKWVVGNKLRMGIFTSRKVKKGEELTFNYNVDRYGADPQPCYCDEPVCTGFLGGKTQTDRAMKLSGITIKALGLQSGDHWHKTVSKKLRKPGAGDEDEEYLNNIQPRPLDDESVNALMACLMQNTEKWITVLALKRIEQCETEQVLGNLIVHHGYKILKSILVAYKKDIYVVIQVLEILPRLPSLTKNKIVDADIEEVVEELKDHEDERVQSNAQSLLEHWSKLETAYRIPRKKRDPNAPLEPDTRENKSDRRRGRSRSKSRTRSRSSSPAKSPPRGPAIPSGPRGGPSGRGFFSGRPHFRGPPRPFGALPEGWFQAVDNARTYYYTATGQTQWVRPTVPANKPIPPPPPKPAAATKALDDLINEITSASTKAKDPEKTSATATPTPVQEEPKVGKKESKEKWKKYPEEKQKKIYENTLFPHVKSIVDKYKNELPKDDCKRFFKEVCKKLVASDYKNNRVQDPTQLSEKRAKDIKKYTKDFFDKAVAKKKAHDQRKEQKKVGSNADPLTGSVGGEAKKDDESDVEPMDASDEDRTKEDPTKTVTPATPLDAILTAETHKRKREETGEAESEEITTPIKRVKSPSYSELLLPPPPPPPPPPPTDTPEESELAQLTQDIASAHKGDEPVMPNAEMVGVETITK